MPEDGTSPAPVARLARRWTAEPRSVPEVRAAARAFAAGTGLQRFAGRGDQA